MEENTALPKKSSNKSTTYLVIFFLVLLVTLLVLALVYLSGQQSTSSDSNLSGQTSTSQTSLQTDDYRVEIGGQLPVVDEENAVELTSSVSTPQIGQTFEVSATAKIAMSNETDTVASVIFEVDPA